MGLAKRVLADKGGSARPEFTSVSRVGCSGHGLGSTTSAKGSVAREVLTGGRDGRIAQRREPAARSCGGRGRRSRRRVLRGSSRALGGTGRCVASL